MDTGQEAHCARLARQASARVAKDEKEARRERLRGVRSER